MWENVGKCGKIKLVSHSDQSRHKEGRRKMYLAVLSIMTFYTNYQYMLHKDYIHILFYSIVSKLRKRIHVIYDLTRNSYPVL